MRRIAFALLVAGLLGGCMSWTPGWRLEAEVGSAGAEVGPLLERGEALLARADSKEGVEAVASVCQEALAADIENLEALACLGESHLLLGAAYSIEVSDKKFHYLQAIQYAERAMSTNSDFLDLVEGGAAIGEAVHSLGERELEAMAYWTTAVSYYFKECLQGLGHVVNFRWMRRTREVMDRMMEIDPTYDHGVVLFSLGIYYLGLPESVGGDLELAADFLQRAAEAGERSLLPRWGRAKYLHVRTGDAEAFRQDLEWVLAQDPRQASSPFAWNVYFQRDARELLESADRLF